MVQSYSIVVHNELMVKHCALGITPKESRGLESKKGTLCQFPANEAFLQSPDQYLPPYLNFRLCPHTTPEIWRLPIWSTILPPPGAHYFLRTRHLGKAPTSSSHQNFIVGH